TINSRVIPAVVSALEDDADSDGTAESDYSTSCPTPLTFRERFLRLESEVDNWAPVKMYQTSALGPFIWGVLRDSPEHFNAHMDAMITSGQAITRRLFALLADNAVSKMYFVEDIEALYFRVHLAMAGIQMRRRMVRDGFLGMCPQVMEWEDPIDSWTSFEDYFGADDFGEAGRAAVVESNKALQAKEALAYGYKGSTPLAVMM
ncbi:hypothetical protein HWV62_4405, partial [Athelia sp. TMB]